MFLVWLVAGVEAVRGVDEDSAADVVHIHPEEAIVEAIGVGAEAIRHTEYAFLNDKPFFEVFKLILRRKRFSLGYSLGP
jgi:hypothetical protein